MRTKTKKSYPDLNPLADAPIDPHAADAAFEQARFDQDTARRAETKRSAEEAQLVQLRSQFIKIIRGWLRKKFIEQPKNTTVGNKCVFARKHLSIRNLCKTDDSVMDEFSEMGFSVTDTLVTALTKVNMSPEAEDHRLK